MLIGYHDTKKSRLKVPQNVQTGGRPNVNMLQKNSAGYSGRQTINPPPGFPAAFPNANLASLPRVSTEPGKMLRRVKTVKKVGSYLVFDYTKTRVLNN